MEPPNHFLSEAGILLNASAARIDRRKFVEYALNPDHGSGGPKAYVFDRVLGFTASDADVLIQLIRTGILTAVAQPRLVDRRGARFSVDLPILGSSGRRAIVRTNWIYPPNEIVPHLTSAFVRKGGRSAQGPPS